MKPADRRTRAPRRRRRARSRPRLPPPPLPESARRAGPVSAARAALGGVAGRAGRVRRGGGPADRRDERRRDHLHARRLRTCRSIPHSARLAQATRQLTSVLGHAVALQVDAALVTPLRSSLEDALADAVEHLARDVTIAPRVAPEGVRARGVAPCARLVSVLGAARAPHSARLDAASGHCRRRGAGVRRPPRRRARRRGPRGRLRRLDRRDAVRAAARPRARAATGTTTSSGRCTRRARSAPADERPAERPGEVRRGSARAVARAHHPIRAHRRRRATGRSRGRSTRTSSTSRTTCSSRTRATRRSCAAPRPTRCSVARRRGGSRG